MIHGLRPQVAPPRAPWFQWGLLCVGLLLALAATPAWAQQGDDLNGNGIPDDQESMFADLERDRQESQNGDGILDGQQDFNGNNLPDGEEDLNGDGTLDGEEDRNSNGVPDGDEDTRRLPGTNPQPPTGGVPGGTGQPTNQPTSAQGPSATEELRTEEQISFKADSQIASDTDETLQLDGNVIVFFRDMTFYCDSARIDNSEQVFYGVGNARMEMPDRIVHGESFWYDYSNDTFVIRKAWGQFDGGLGEPVHFVSRTVRGHVKDFKLVATTLTTCTPDEDREWHIKASMVKLLPDKKVIMRNATFYFYGIPLFWFPYYDWSLEETAVIVEVGKNRTEGTYVKLRFNYLYDPADYLFGAITTSYRSRLGYTFGTDHRYALNNNEWPGTLKTDTEFLTDGKGTKTAYSFAVTQSFDFMHNEITGNVSANQTSRANVQAGNRSESASANINLNRQKTGADNMGIRFSFTQQKTTSISATSTFNFTHAHQFTKNSTLNSSINYGSQNGSNGLANDQRVDLSSELGGRTTFKGKELLDWRLSYKQALDPDGNRALKQFLGDTEAGGGDPDPDPADPGNDTFETPPPDTKLVDPDFLSQSQQELPKLTINIRPGVLGNKKNLSGIETTRTQLTFAHFVQRRAQDRINAVFAEADLGFRRAWDPDKTNAVDLTLGYKQNFTGTGDALFSYSPTARWERNESKIFKQSLNWTYNDTEGASPITSGTGGGNSSNLQYTMTYNTRQVQWNATSGRNLINHQWSPINLQGTWTPHPGVGDFRMGFGTGYDLENDTWRDLTFNADWTDFRKFKTNFNLSYSLEDDEIREIRNQTTYKFNPQLFTEFNLRWGESQQDPAILQDIIVTWLRDCTFWQFTYRAQGDIFVVNAGITAYPSKGFAYGVNASNLIQNPFQQFGEGFGAGPGGFSGGGFNFGGSGF